MPANRKYAALRVGCTQVSVGGDMPANMDVMVFDYDYVCDTNYQHCHDREQYWFNKRYGLVRWEHQVLNADGVTYGTPNNMTIFNQIKAGAPPVPHFPCF
jgi:hypothetical protein